MATMNISVPDPLKDWVQSQVSKGSYANTSDYVRDLIRQDQENRNKIQALRQALIEGEKSGDAGELDMEAIRRKAKQRVGLIPKDA